MPSIHAVVPRQLSSTWSLVTAGRGSSIDGSALDDAPSPGTGVWDAGAVSAAAVPTVGTATSDVPSDLFSAFGRRLRLPATTRRGARETTARAARDAPRRDAIGVVGWRRASVVIVAGRLLKCALSSRRVHGKFNRGSEKKTVPVNTLFEPLSVSNAVTRRSAEVSAGKGAPAGRRTSGSRRRAGVVRGAAQAPGTRPGAAILHTGYGRFFLHSQKGDSTGHPEAGRRRRGFTEVTRGGSRTSRRRFSHERERSRIAGRGGRGPVLGRLRGIRPIA